MPRNRLSQLGLWLVVAGLAAPSLPAMGLPIIDVGSIADAIEDCNLDVATAPVWADSLSFAMVDGAADSFVNGATAFVSSGDGLSISVTFVNRVPGGCEALETLLGPDLGAVQVYRRYDGDGGAWSKIGSCANVLQSGGASCGVTDELEIAGSSGEQRVRYLAVAVGASPSRLAGIERVLVNGARPDLSASSLAWSAPADPADRHTVYGIEAISEFAFGVANGGAYPSWDPNGGVDLWGRSSFDATGDGDESPDDEVGPDDPAFAEREQRYTGEESVLPHCAGAGWMDDTGGAPLCSYKRGARFDMPVHAEVSRGGELLEVHDFPAWGLHPTGDEMIEDKDGSILHAGNEAGAPNGQTFFLPMLDRRYTAGVHDLAVEVAASAPDASAGDQLIVDDADVHGADLRVAYAHIATPGACGWVPADPCPAGTPIALSAAYENAGDPITDGVDAVLERSWKAGVYVHGELAALVEEESIAPTVSGAVPLWDGLIIATNPLGGPQLVQLRLDAVENYGDDAIPVTNPLGHVAERSEDADCVPGASDEDNTFCALLFFAPGGPAPPPPLPDIHVLDLSAVVRSVNVPGAEPVENPLTGFDVEFDLANDGAGDAAEAFAVQLVACATAASEPEVVPACELVRDWHVDALSSGHTVALSAHWDAVARTGPIDLCAVAIYGGDEVDAGNNLECVRVEPVGPPP